MSLACRSVDCSLWGVACYYLTSSVVLLGVFFGAQLLGNQRAYHPEQDRWSRFANWDGQAYALIAEHGYSYRADDRNYSAFFPALPLLGRWLDCATGMPTVLALVMVAHFCLAAAFLGLAAYLNARSPEAPTELTWWTLLAFGLLPTTFFFRMAYSESLFVLITVLVLYGITHKWPLLALALLVGLGTATRPVGGALVPVLVLYAWRRDPRRVRSADRFHDHGPHSGPYSAGALSGQVRRLGRVAGVSLLGCWGLAAFMFYLWQTFGDPLAFARAQLTWNLRAEQEYTFAQAAWATATLEPIWAVYVPSKVEYWAHYDKHGNPLFSLQFANPIYFVGTVVLVVVGWRKKWLNDYEVLLSAGLLLIPYVTKSYDNAMASFGRFSAVVLPAYIVMGHLLQRLPAWLSVALLTISALLLAAYSAMFGAWYPFI
jgi:hypothetical protein